MTLTSEGRNGLLIEGTKGRIFVNRGTLSGAPVDALRDDPLPEDAITKVRGERPWDHMMDFVESVKVRRQPISDASSHHRAITTCHLAGIAGRLNRPVAWDPVSEAVVGDPVALAMQARVQRKGYEVPA